MVQSNEPKPYLRDIDVIAAELGRIEVMVQAARRRVGDLIWQGANPSCEVAADYAMNARVDLQHMLTEIPGIDRHNFTPATALPLATPKS